MRIITAKTIDIGFAHPIEERLCHSITHSRLLIVERHHIFPVHFIGHGRGVPFGVLLIPGVIPSRMVSNPIEDNEHAILMAGFNERTQIINSAERRVNCVVVFYAVRRIDGLDCSSRVNRHQP